MPSFQTLLPFHIDSFLDKMAQLYSQIEREMHLRLNKGEKIGQMEKSLQVKYQVDSTTVRNVYHNLIRAASPITYSRWVNAKRNFS